MENAKTLAEIDQIYSQINLNRAEEKRILIEVNEREFKLKARQLKVVLGMYKSIAIQDKSQSAIVSLRIIDAMMETIKLLEQDGPEANV